MNICSDRVDIGSVSETLRMVQTTSPSYLLMASLDVNEKIMRSKCTDLIKSWKDDISYFYSQASRIHGLTFVSGSGTKNTGAADEEVFPLFRYREGPDPTKINLSMTALGLSGERLDRELRYRGIVCEMVHGDYVLLMTGAGNVRSDYERLLDALKDIAGSYGIGTSEAVPARSFREADLETADVPLEYELVPLFNADGRVLYDPIITYPPGTPVACPGEILNMEVINRIAESLSEGDAITGIDEEGRIKAGIGY